MVPIAELKVVAELLAEFGKSVVDDRLSALVRERADAALRALPAPPLVPLALRPVFVESVSGVVPLAFPFFPCTGGLDVAALEDATEDPRESGLAVATLLGGEVDGGRRHLVVAPAGVQDRLGLAELVGGDLLRQTEASLGEA